MRKLGIFHTLALATAIAIMPGVRTASAGIVVSPLKQEVTVKPGHPAKFYISITNNARNRWDKAQSVHLEVMDFSVCEVGGITFKPPGIVKNSASKWITLGQSDLTLAPGKGERVECAIRVPHSALGEYYSAVMVVLDRKGRTKSGLAIGYRIASGVFVTVAGRTFPKQAKLVRCGVVWPKEAAEVSDLDELGLKPSTQPATQPPTTQPAEAAKLKPVRVLAVLKNTGRVRFNASGELRISDAQGRIVYRVPMTTKRARVLPDATRLFEAQLDKAVPPGQYTLKVELDYQSKWAKARKRLPLTISADQAALLARITARTNPTGTDKASGSMIEVAPEKLTARIPPGGFRSLKAVVKNTGKDTVQCTAAIANEGDAPVSVSWIALGSDQFTLGKGRSKTLSLIVRVPSEAAGLYNGALVVEATAAAGTKSGMKIPIELMIRAGKL